MGDTATEGIVAMTEQAGSIEVFHASARDDLIRLVTIERDRVRFVHNGTEGRWAFAGAST